MIQNALHDDLQPVRQIVVLGGGSAGFLVALALKKKLPDTPLTVVRSTRMGVIGVGEGTVISVVNFLHRVLGIDSQEFHERVHPSIKLGIRYLWGTRPFFNYTFSPQLSAPLNGVSRARGFYCRDSMDYADISSALMVEDKVCLQYPDGHPKFASSIAYHLENRTFVNYLEELADEWKIPKIDDVVEHVETGERGVEALVLESGQRVTADLFVDCSGFRSELLGRALGEPFVDFSDALFCDRAVVGGWPRTDEIYHPFTTAETMNAGWCWRIEHDELVNRGYVYSSAFVSDEEAEREYRELCPKVEKTHVVKFRCGVYRRAWVKNVVAIGNAYGFVEPLEATAIGMVCDTAAHLAKGLQSVNGGFYPIQVEMFNRIVDRNWSMIRDFLAIHYKFNRRKKTQFWKACQADVQLGDIGEIVDFYQTVGPDFGMLFHEFRRDIFTTEGYLAMLVGQEVPYRQEIELSESETARWNAHKSRIRQIAQRGMDMTSCLNRLREAGLRGFAADDQPSARL